MVAPHATFPTNSCVYNQSALVTCDANHSTDATHWQANSGKQCERVRCGIPPRIVSGALDGCPDCKVYFGGTLLYSCSLGPTLDGSPHGSKTFNAGCDMMGRYANRHHYTVVVCRLTKAPEECDFDE